MAGLADDHASASAARNFNEFLLSTSQAASAATGTTAAGGPGPTLAASGLRATVEPMAAGWTVAGLTARGSRPQQTDGAAVTPGLHPSQESTVFRRGTSNAPYSGNVGVGNGAGLISGHGLSGGVHVPGLDDLQRKVLDTSRRLRASLLFRAAGGAFPRAVTMMLMFAVYIPLTWHALARITPGISMRRLPPHYWTAAMSTALHFLVLPYFIVPLMKHVPTFESKFTRLRKTFLYPILDGNADHVGPKWRPLGLITLYLQARTVAAFTIAALSIVGLYPSTLETLSAAAAGAALLIADILHPTRLVFPWARLVGDAKKSSATSGSRMLIVSITLAFCWAAAAAFRQVHDTSKTQAIGAQMAATILFAPWPTMGMAELVLNRAASRILWTPIRLVLVWCCVIWTARFLRKMQTDIAAVVASCLVSDHRDLLLVANAKTWPDQLYLMAHALSACQELPAFLPMASSVAIVDLRTPTAAFSQAASAGYLAPSEPVLRVPEFVTHYGALPRNIQWPRPISWAVWLKTLPYVALRAVLNPLLLNRLPIHWLSALHLVACQAAAEHWLAKAVVYIIDSRSFLNMLPSDLSAGQLRCLLGRSRSKFFEWPYGEALLVYGSGIRPVTGGGAVSLQDETVVGGGTCARAEPRHNVLSYAAGELMFGSQIYPIFVSRLASSLRSLQRMFEVCDILLSIPPSGVSTQTAAMTPGLAVRNSSPRNPSGSLLKRDAIFRYDRFLVSQLEAVVNSFVGDELLNPRVLAEFDGFLSVVPPELEMRRQAATTLGGNPSLPVPTVTLMRSSFGLKDDGAAAGSTLQRRTNPYLPVGTAPASVPSATNWRPQLGPCWLRFSDGTVGLSYYDRERLVKSCEECLLANMLVCQLGLEAAKHIVRARVHFHPQVLSGLGGSRSSAFSGAGPEGLLQTQQFYAGAATRFGSASLLHRYFPSVGAAATAAGEGAMGGSVSDGGVVGGELEIARDFLRLTIPLVEQSRQLAKMSVNPPFTWMPDIIVDAASDFAEYSAQWVRDFAAAQSLNPHSMEPIRLTCIPSR